jgi:alkylhydroperoxidase/carboxymuconolactone decarboxylase family protein YurZ
VKIAFATCAALPDGWNDDHPVAALVGAEYRVWDDEAVDWAAYDRVVLGSVWDYSGRVDEFLAWCAAVGAERLRNPPALVAFNADKRYLGELSVPSVPTTFVAPGDEVPALEGRVVVKPNVSAGALDTGRFSPPTHGAAVELIKRICASGRVALVQPYRATIEERGETAVVFVGGQLSHVLSKRPVLRSRPASLEEYKRRLARLRAAPTARRIIMSVRYDAALELAGELLGRPLELPLGPGEPESGHEFRRLATLHTFGDSWSRTGQLDTRTRSLISVAIAAALGTHEPLRGQLRIALNNGVSKDEIVELFIHLEAYAGAARAFDSYQIAAAVFAEQT